jgi:quercetin dioxygenase-like cupin family protein
MPKKRMAKKKLKPKTVPRRSAKRVKSLPGTVMKAAAKAGLQHIPWHTVALEDLNPLLRRQFVVGQEIMVARVLLKKGCIVPEHSHHNEQITYILEGALKFWIDGREIVINAGEVLTIPSNCRTRRRRSKIPWISTSSIHPAPTGSTKPTSIFATGNSK